MSEVVSFSPGHRLPVLNNNHLATNAIWSIAARVVYIFSQLGLVASLAWMANPLEVGTLIFVLAVTGPFFMLTNLQLRVVLATDAAEEFPVALYRKLRLLTASATFFCICVVSIWMIETTSTQLVFCTVALAKTIEAISDIHIGLLEREEQIATSSHSLMLRGVFAIIAFSGSYFLWQSLAASCTFMAFVWFIILLLHDLPKTRQLILSRESLLKRMSLSRFHTNEIISLIKRAWPLGLATMITSLQVNFPRLWTGHLFGDHVLGIFGVLFQIAIAGKLLGNALCCPLIPRIAKLCDDKHRQHSSSIYAIGVMTVIGVCLGGFLLLALQPLLQATIGARYLSDTLLLRVLCAIVPVYLIQTALISVFRAKRRFTIILACEAGTLAVLIGLSIAIGHNLGLVGPAFAMFVAVLGSTAAYLVLLIWDGINLSKNATHLQSTTQRIHYAA